MNEIAGERDGSVVVRVTAPATEGRANEALGKLVAKRLGVAKGSVEIVSGATRREKVLRVDGLSSGEARRRLGL